MRMLIAVPRTLHAERQEQAGHDISFLYVNRVRLRLEVTSPATPGNTIRLHPWEPPGKSYFQPPPDHIQLTLLLLGNEDHHRS